VTIKLTKVEGFLTGTTPNINLSTAQHRKLKKR